MIFNATSGSNPLNFKVVAGTTEPSNPKVNMIWVKTSETVVSWKLAKQSSIPTFTAVKGRLLISYSSIDSVTTTNANFDALKITSSQPNSIMVGLNAAYLNTNGTASGWTKVNAYIYKSSGWVQFSAGFTATIKVTYPAGSYVVCLPGTAWEDWDESTGMEGDTSGSYTFVVPSTGTWFIGCRTSKDDWSQTDSTTVSITTDGQSASVTLTFFDGYLLKDGSWSDYACPNGITSGFNLSNITSATYSGNAALRLKSQCQAFTADKIDVSSYTTLKATLVSVYSATFTLGLAATQSTSSMDTSSMVAYGTSTTVQTISLDVSSVTGAYYLVIKSISGSTNDGQGVYITNIWLS